LLSFQNENLKDLGKKIQDYDFKAEYKREENKIFILANCCFAA